MWRLLMSSLGRKMLTRCGAQALLGAMRGGKQDGRPAEVLLALTETKLVIRSTYTQGKGSSPKAACHFNTQQGFTR